MSTPAPDDPPVGQPPSDPVPRHDPPWDATTLERALEALKKEK